MTYKQGDSEYAAWKKYMTYDDSHGFQFQFCLYRYADLLLVLAEAANEIGSAVCCHLFE